MQRAANHLYRASLVDKARLKKDDHAADIVAGSTSEGLLDKHPSQDFGHAPFLIPHKRLVRLKLPKTLIHKVDRCLITAYIPQTVACIDDKCVLRSQICGCDVRHIADNIVWKHRHLQNEVA